MAIKRIIIVVALTALALGLWHRSIAPSYALEDESEALKVEILFFWGEG